MTDDMEQTLAAFRATLTWLGVPPGVPDDVVVIYAIMRDAATALGALYAGRVTVGGLADPAVTALRALDAEIAAVDVDDLAAQRAMTRRLRARYAELVAEGGESRR